MTRGNGTQRPGVSVQIAGREYKVRSGGDPEALRRIAGYVDQAMERVKRGTGTVDSLDVAVLTCLNLGREIIALREERVPSDSTVVDDADLRGLIERVEALLPADCALFEVGADNTQAAIEASPESPRTPGEGGGADESERARTLEWPTPEVLREGSPVEEDHEDEAPVQRWAASGGERAS